MFTLELGPCLGLGLDYKATEYVTLGAQASLLEIMAGLNRRHLSIRTTVDEYIEYGPVGGHVLLEDRAYTGGTYSLSYANAGLKTPEDKIFQEARDFWALAFSVQGIFVSLRLEAHPVELWDFFAGWILLDPLNDDLGSSKAIKLSPIEKNIMGRLGKQVMARGKLDHIAPKPSSK